MMVDPKSFDVERVYEGALRILEKIGVQVANEGIRSRLAGRLPLNADRVCFPREIVGHYLDEIRRQHGYAPGRPLPESDPYRPMGMVTSWLNCTWLDPDDGRLKLQDTQAVIRNTHLLQSCVKAGLVEGCIAGMPQDVPGEMQYIMAQYLNCVYNPRPGGMGLLPSKSIARYCLEMGQAMGFGVGIGTEMISPLRFMGQSIDIAFELQEDLAWIGIDPMPILGVTAPADWHMAWSLSVAENLASYILFRSCGIEKAGAGSFRLFLPNPATAMTCFSSPRHITALLTRRKLKWELLGIEDRSSELLLVTAKAADQQAAAEKMAGFALARAFGFHWLEGAGGLFLDEIFSPEQLIIDIELKRYADSIGSPFRENREDIVAVMEDGVRSGGFLRADLTLERFFDFAWRPGIFDLRLRTAWEADPQPLLAKARRAAREMAAEPEFELQGTKREALERILQRARKELG